MPQRRIGRARSTGVTMFRLICAGGKIAAQRSNLAYGFVRKSVSTWKALLRGASGQTRRRTLGARREEVLLLVRWLHPGGPPSAIPRAFKLGVASVGALHLTPRVIRGHLYKGVHLNCASYAAVDE